MGQEMDDQVPAQDRDRQEEDFSLISSSLGRMRMMIGRRIIGRIALQQTEPGLELTHLDVIDAVRRRAPEGEVTVGAIAEFIRVDPSRSSRLVADLVQRGLLRRTVSQEDARRSVVELTERAHEYFRVADRVKQGFIRDITADWSAEDLDRFAVLLERFVTGFEDRARMQSEVGPESMQARAASQAPAQGRGGVED